MCTDNNVDSGASKMIGWPMGRRREKGKGGGEGLQQLAARVDGD